MRYNTWYQQQRRRWDRYIGQLGRKVDRAFPNGFIDANWGDVDEEVMHIMREENYSLEVQKFSWKSQRKANPDLTFEQFQRDMTKRKVKGFYRQRAKTVNVWSNVTNSASTDRVVASIRREVKVLQGRVDYLRGQRDITDKQQVSGSLTRLKDLASRSSDKTKGSAKRKIRTLERNLDTWSDNKIKREYNRILTMLEDDIIENKQDGIAETAVSKGAGSPGKRTAQSTLSEDANTNTLESEKEKGKKYVKYRLNPNRTWGGNDMCDDFAKANPTGKGAGVYEIDKCPIPVRDTHPYCGCSIEPYND